MGCAGSGVWQPCIMHVCISVFVCQGLCDAVGDVVSSMLSLGLTRLKGFGTKNMLCKRAWLYV